MDTLDDKDGIIAAQKAKIADMEASILEKADIIVAKNAEIADLKRQLMVMRNVVNSPSPLKPQVDEKPATNRHESIYPRLYEVLMETSAKVTKGEITMDQSAEIRQCCKLAAEISEVQSKAISFSRKPAERKFEVSKR